MNDIPALIVHFHPPTADERVPLTLTSFTGTTEAGSLKLPFTFAQIPLLLRALNARQYPDYPQYERFFRSGDDRSALIGHLCALGIWEGSDKSGAVAADVHARVGRMLGAALLADSGIRRFLDDLYNMAIQGSSGEIILSFDSAAMALAALPWEVTHSGLQPLLLTRGTILSCTRVIAFSHAMPPPRPAGERLHILTLAPHAGFNQIGRQFEIRAREHLAAELHDLPVIREHLSPVTMADLYQRLERQSSIDVLDYYGHGRFRDGVGALQFDGLAGSADWVPASRLTALPNLPPVIVLHACQSAQEDTIDPLAGVASALSAAGVRIVVAMQLTTRMTAATDGVAPILYRKLAAGWSIQRAVATVRQALYTAEPDGASWYLPALYLRQPDHRPCLLLEPPTPPPNPFAGMGALDDPTRFIGREAQIRRLWDRLRAGGNLTIVGPASSGKSATLKLIAAEARSRIEPTIEVIPLTIHEGLKRTEVHAELVNWLNGRRAIDLTRLIRGRHLILLLDDLGFLDRGSRGLEVRQWLRHLSHNRALATIQLIATSQRPLHQIFTEDRPIEASPLHDSMRDMIELGPFTELEARRFIASRLRGTPFKEFEFETTLRGALTPGALQEACRDLYDTLCQSRF